MHYSAASLKPRFNAALSRNTYGERLCTTDFERRVKCVALGFWMRPRPGKNTLTRRTTMPPGAILAIAVLLTSCHSEQRSHVSEANFGASPTSSIASLSSVTKATAEPSSPLASPTQREVDGRNGDQPVTLDWQTSEPRPNSFEAVAGDLTQYRVHYAESHARELPAVGRAVSGVVAKALGFASAYSGDRGKRLVFLWDVVYATLTVVYTDNSMMHDAHNVTKCYFAELDQARLGEQSSEPVRHFVTQELARQRGKLLPAALPAYFSDQDRASEGADFSAQLIDGG